MQTIDHRQRLRINLRAADDADFIGTAGFGDMPFGDPDRLIQRMHDLSALNPERPVARDDDVQPPG
jgi:hypothetical protein